MCVFLDRLEHRVRSYAKSESGLRLLLRDVLVVDRLVNELLYDAEAAISRSIAARCSALSTTNSTPATHMIFGLPVTAIVWTARASTRT